ncbi:MAG: hypothetical protein ACYDDO_06665 [Acidiferrobacterales bacterium]
MLIGVLVQIPLAGGLVLALLAPMLLASAYLDVDTISRLKIPLPASLRIAAIKKSPAELLGVFRAESRVIPAALIGLYSAAVAVLANILMQIIAGDAWASHWESLGVVAFLGVLAASVLGILIYLLLALSLVYAVPLTFLQHEPVVSAIRRSLQVGMKHLPPLLVVLVVLLLPLLVFSIFSLASAWLAYPAALALGVVVLPVVVTSLYCSYRTLFPVTEPTR